MVRGGSEVALDELFVEQYDTEPLHLVDLDATQTSTEPTGITARVPRQAGEVDTETQMRHAYYVLSSARQGGIAGLSEYLQAQNCNLDAGMLDISEANKIIAASQAYEKLLRERAHKEQEVIAADSDKLEQQSYAWGILVPPTPNIRVVQGGSGMKVAEGYPLKVDGWDFEVRFNPDKYPDKDKATAVLSKLAALIDSPIARKHPEIRHEVEEALTYVPGTPYLDPRAVLSLARGMAEEAEKHDRPGNVEKLQWYDSQPGFNDYVRTRPDIKEQLDNPKVPFSQKVAVCKQLWNDKTVRDVMFRLHAELSGPPQDFSLTSQMVRTAVASKKAKHEVVLTTQPTSPVTPPILKVVANEGNYVKDAADLVIGPTERTEEVIIVGDKNISSEQLNSYFQTFRFRYVEKHPLGKQERAAAKIDSQLKREPGIEQKVALVTMRMQELAEAVKLRTKGNVKALDKSIQIHNRVLNTSEENLEALAKLVKDMGIIGG